MRRIYRSYFYLLGSLMVCWIFAALFLTLTSDALLRYFCSTVVAILQHYAVFLCSLQHFYCKLSVLLLQFFYIFVAFVQQFLLSLYCNFIALLQQIICNFANLYFLFLQHLCCSFSSSYLLRSESRPHSQNRHK